jgi:hypothetical protein
MQRWPQWETASKTDWGAAAERESVIRALAGEERLTNEQLREAMLRLNLVSHGGGRRWRLCRHRERARVNDCNSRIADEVVFIERQQVSNAMDKHRGDEPSIVDLDTHYRMDHHEPTPFHVDLFPIGQQGKRDSIRAARRSVSAMFNP